MGLHSTCSKTGRNILKKQLVAVAFMSTTYIPILNFNLPVSLKLCEVFVGERRDNKSASTDRHGNVTETTQTAIYINSTAYYVKAIGNSICNIGPVSLYTALYCWHFLLAG